MLMSRSYCTRRGWHSLILEKNEIWKILASSILTLAAAKEGLTEVEE